MTKARDHGGGLDAAIAQFGGTRDTWIDLSTGINPVPYLIGPLGGDIWTALPDRAATDALDRAARSFWNIPDDAMVVAAPGASALIAQMPRIAAGTRVCIQGPTYNEHAAAFAAQGWTVTEDNDAPVYVVVHPNNPDGRYLIDHTPGQRSLTVIDESFCDVAPTASYIRATARPGTIVLKSFGKFWGLAGLRLGFAVGHPDSLAGIHDLLGPWAVSGPALQIGAQALSDVVWATQARARLKADAARLDTLMLRAGATGVQGTDLFRTYDVTDAQAWRDKLAQSHIWSRIFPYSDSWLRLGLPAPEAWGRLEATLP